MITGPRAWCVARGEVAMARMTRPVVPGVPHHVTERGARRREDSRGLGDAAAGMDVEMPS